MNKYLILTEVTTQETQTLSSAKYTTKWLIIFVQIKFIFLFLISLAYNISYFDSVSILKIISNSHFHFTELN